MELNRKQALEILEKFDLFLGQRAGRELWQSKPFEVQEQDIANFSRDVTLIIDYIKELTEENERLKSVEFTCGFIKPHKVLECPIFDEIIRTKSDTVREIQTRFAMHFGTYDEYEETRVAYVFRLLKKFEEEILEETK